MKITVTRFTCDAPDCKDKVDVEGMPVTPTVAVVSDVSQIPDGWIEFTVRGSGDGAPPVLVYASTPECAAKLAEAQVEVSVDAAAAAAEERERREEQAAEDQKEAEKEARKQAKEEAKRQAEILVAEEERQAEEADEESKEADQS